MADQKISELTAITGANTADDDLLVIVDTSTGETKKITLAELEAGIAKGSYVGDLTGNVTGDLTGNVTGDLTGESTLPALSASISDTAVDVFVYDTRKDSDGGAWRKRTQHTSWYNETLNTATRGSRKEFPAVAVIVAEATQVTIYDGDDPSLPMWMVFNTGGDVSWIAGWRASIATNLATLMNAGLSSISMRNGILSSGHNSTIQNSGLRVLNFIKETTQAIGKTKYSTATSLRPFAKRNDRFGDFTSLDPLTTDGRIPDDVVNDVAMTVLPNAPIDSATGLPVPTIAVATDGGVSVIKDDGTVVDIATASAQNNTKEISFDTNGDLWFASQNSGGLTVYYAYYKTAIPSSDIDYSTLTSYRVDDVGIPALGTKVVTSSSSTINKAVSTANNQIIATPYCLTLLDENTTTPSEGSVAYITSTYNTGWMNGDIKLATLSDTDTTDVTGTELVTNGTFDSDTSGWTQAGSGQGTWSVSSGRVSQSGQTSFSSYLYQAITCVVGKTYTLSFEVYSQGNGNAIIGIGTTGTGVVNNAWQDGDGTGFFSVTFTATSTTHYVIVQEGTATTPHVLDNFSVRLAEEDRSVNGNGLQVFGTVTKSPVATGADLVAYSGFSSSNYLEQPYNSDLDFGTGDFCVMGWVNITTGSITNSIISHCQTSGSTTDGDWLFRVLSDNTATVFVRDASAWVSVSSNTTIPTNVWVNLCAVRQNGTATVYVNGVASGSAGLAGQIVADGITGIGTRLGFTSEYLRGSLALWRISGTAPTAEQIAKIYEDEKVLFQEGAQATLYGSSDAVTALAYDDSTNILSVGTSAGRSDFSGLRRVNNTTTGVTTAISASNSLIVEQ